MTYELAFLEPALKEWRKLDGQTKDHFKKKLLDRLEQPRVPSAKLAGHPDRYKIKLRQIGYRLVYEMRDREVVVLVIAVGRRDRDAVYRLAAQRDD